MPVTKARVKLVLEATVDLDPESDLTSEEQLNKLMAEIVENPQQLNQYSIEQSLEGEVFQVGE